MINARIAVLLIAGVLHGQSVVVGSKLFTESVILGEVIGHCGHIENVSIEHRRELGGTRIVWDALLNGEIDIYPEYTGTMIYEILAAHNIRSQAELRSTLDSLDLELSEPLGFNNTYAFGMRREHASQLEISSISQLASFPDLLFGFSNEFMDREDGWPRLRDAYHLPQRNVFGLDHNLAYRGLAEGQIDVIDLYTTDAEIEHYDLVALEDDLEFFPRYDAVFVYRRELASRYPELVRRINQLANAIPERTMIGLNRQVKIDEKTESEVAQNFLNDLFSLDLNTLSTGRRIEFTRYLLDHFQLFLLSLGCAILTAIPLGIAASKRPLLGQVILGITGVIQTIPSLALLVLFIPLLGIGFKPAVTALFLYSLLPIVRNTAQGLNDIPRSLTDTARVLGLPPAYRLWHIELPMAASAILSGVKTSAVINIGTATLGALIGAGGLGQPILTGIRLNDMRLILVGAVPAALLALLVQGIFEVLERSLTPRGLRIR